MFAVREALANLVLLRSYSYDAISGSAVTDTDDERAQSAGRNTRLLSPLGDLFESGFQPELLDKIFSRVSNHRLLGHWAPPLDTPHASYTILFGNRPEIPTAAFVLRRTLRKPRNTPPLSTSVSIRKRRIASQ